MAYGGMGLGLVGGIYARYIEPFRPKLERIPMDLSNLGEPFAGYRIIQLSDVHVGREMPTRYLEEQFAKCAAMKPDLIVVTGDFLTNAYPGQIETACGLMKGLSARDGILACLGNHDYHHNKTGPRRPFGTVAKELTAALQNVGVRVLRNEVHVIARGGARLQIVGLDDWWRGFYDSRKAFSRVDPNVPCIALQHNPDAIFDLVNRPCQWVLCGHTHGGQVRVPLVGALYLPVDHTEYDKGLFDVEGTRLYVSRGIGYIHQIRFDCPPEITEFTLTRRA